MTKALIAIAFIFTILATGAGLGFAFVTFSPMAALAAIGSGCFVGALLIAAAYSTEYEVDGEEDAS